MIKVEKNECWVNAESTPEMMTDLTVAIRGIKSTLIEKSGLGEKEAELLIRKSVNLGMMSDEEVKQEAAKMSKEGIRILFKDFFV